MSTLQCRLNKKYNGHRDWATTYGETGDYTWNEEGLAIAMDPTAGLAVGGRLYQNIGTPGFVPVTPANAFVQNVGGAFVMHFNHDFQVSWSTPFGGYNSGTPPYTQITDMRFVRTDNFKLWITGANGGPGMQFTPPPGGTGFYHNYTSTAGVFFASFDIASHQLEYCTGWGNNEISMAYGLDYDGKSVWVVGGTEDKDLTDVDLPNPDPGNPAVHHSLGLGIVSPGWQNSDAFVLAINPVNYTLEYGTLIGGLAYDMLLDVAHDQQSVYLIGETRSSGNFSMNGLNGGPADLDPDQYFQVLNPNQTSRDVLLFAMSQNMAAPALKWSTAFGGTLSDRGWGIAATQSEVYITGATASNSWDFFPLLEFDPNDPNDFYQDYNLLGTGSQSDLEFYGFDFGLHYEHFTHNLNPEPLNQGNDAFIACFGTVLLPVGIQNTSEETVGYLHFTPLPAIGQWAVQFPTVGNWKLAAWNSAGQEVGNWHVHGSALIVDLSQDAAGLYLLRATRPNCLPLHGKLLRP